ncbi:MAG: ABC transporter ATP-binding protein [Mycoplasma sp.]
MSDLIINCKNICLKNNEVLNEDFILKNISFSVHKNDFLIILGKSGSGKTTLLNIIAGLIEPTSGSVNIFDKDITKINDDEKTYWRRYYMGYIFQNYGLFNTLNVYDNIKISANLNNLMSKRAKKYFDNYKEFRNTNESNVDEVMKKLNISELKNKFPNELSGGQQQRVSLARTILKNPPIILADEPTGALDSETSDVVINMLFDMHLKGTTIIMITHNEDLIKYANKVIYLSDGKINSIYDNDNSLVIKEAGARNV